MVADRSRRVLETVDQLISAVVSMRSSMGSDLQVAASMTIAEHLMPGWLFKLGAADPNLHVALRVANSRQVQDLVVNAEVNIGFVESPKLDPRLTSICVARDRLVVVAAPDSAWARSSRPLSLEDLAAGPSWCENPGPAPARRSIGCWGKSRQTKPLLELGSNEAVKGAVIAGAGAAVLSVLAVSVESTAEQLVEVPVDGVDLGRELCAVWQEEYRLSGPSATLLQQASSVPPAGAGPG